MFESSKIVLEDVASVTIGTTHFINAVVEMDRARLAKVAIIRLSGPFSKGVPPCVDWPARLRSLICQYYCLVDGGLEVDGNQISDINEDEVREQAEIIREKGVKKRGNQRNLQPRRCALPSRRTGCQSHERGVSRSRHSDVQRRGKPGISGEGKCRDTECLHTAFRTKNDSSIPGCHISTQTELSGVRDTELGDHLVGQCCLQTSH